MGDGLVKIHGDVDSLRTSIMSEAPRSKEQGASLML